MILPYILKTIWWTNVIIGILNLFDANIYHTKCMWVSCLHFMIPWFCLISWRLLNGFMLCWRYWFSVTPTLNWNYIRRSATYISCFSDFASYLEDYLMDKCLIGMLNPCDAKIYQIKCTVYVGQWPTFHGPVMLSYILKTIWWINIVQEILNQCDTNIELKLHNM